MRANPITNHYPGSPSAFKRNLEPLRDHYAHRAGTTAVNRFLDNNALEGIIRASSYTSCPNKNDEGNGQRDKKKLSETHSISLPCQV